MMEYYRSTEMHVYHSLLLLLLFLLDFLELFPLYFFEYCRPANLWLRPTNFKQEPANFNQEPAELINYPIRQLCARTQQ